MTTVTQYASIKDVEDCLKALVEYNDGCSSLSLWMRIVNDPEDELDIKIARRWCGEDLCQKINPARKVFKKFGLQIRSKSRQQDTLNNCMLLISFLKDKGLKLSKILSILESCGFTVEDVSFKVYCLSLYGFSMEYKFD